MIVAARLCVRSVGEVGATLFGGRCAVSVPRCTHIFVSLYLFIFSRFSGNRFNKQPRLEVDSCLGARDSGIAGRWDWEATVSDIIPRFCIGVSPDDTLVPRRGCLVVIGLHRTSSDVVARRTAGLYLWAGLVCERAVWTSSDAVPAENFVKWRAEVYIFVVTKRGDGTERSDN